MKFPIDSYDLKARYAPAFLLALPVLVTFWTCFQAQIELISELFSGFISAAVWYALSVLVRSLGKRIEPVLWKSWGGPPSTLYVSWKNTRLGDDLKAKYHELVRQKLGLPMPSRQDEESHPNKAAEIIAQAFSRVKGILRREDKTGLWSIANAEYGFARNLYGSRVLWLIISILMTAVCAGFLWKSWSTLILLGLVFDLFILLACSFFGWLILPRYTKEVGFRYAEHAWESFCNIAERKGRNSRNGVIEK
ncbi:MAG: hypothetical protein ACFFCW_36770 [Candidatus Hodarchaeota archaeon]